MLLGKIGSEVLCFKLIARRQQGRARRPGCGEVQTLQRALFDLLDEEVPLVFGGLAVVGAYDAGGPVQVQHVDQLLLLVLQLLDLRLQLGVQGLELLRLLTEREKERAGPG